MRGARSKLALAVAVILCTAGLRASLGHAQDGGITVTPAMLTLRLAANTGQSTTQFTLINHYAVRVGLRFAFEPRLDGATDFSPSTALRISQTTTSLAPGASITQTVTVDPVSSIAPGSHLADLVVTQTDVQAGSVGLTASIRMPITIVQEDGAVRSLVLALLATPWLRTGAPSSLGVTVRNTGNVVSIPRGVITVTGPGGGVLQRGVLNLGSQAVAPQGTLTLQTPLAHLASATWPGIYRLTVRYGLGGGQGTQVASRSFVYVAWWHAAILALLLAGAWFGVRLLRRPAVAVPQTTSPVPLNPEPKKRVLVGRDVL